MKKDAFSSNRVCRTYAMNDFEYWRTELAPEERENTGFEGIVRRGGGVADRDAVEMLSSDEG